MIIGFQLQKALVTIFPDLAYSNNSESFYKKPLNRQLTTIQDSTSNSVF